jgi:hypothetical protein
MHAYEKITFEEAVKIIWHNCAYNKQMLFEVMNDLVTYSDQPWKMITPFWYDNYQLHLANNKKGK